MVGGKAPCSGDMSEQCSEEHTLHRPDIAAANGTRLTNETLGAALTRDQVVAGAHEHVGGLGQADSAVVARKVFTCKKSTFSTYLYFPRGGGLNSRARVHFFCCGGHAKALSLQSVWRKGAQCGDMPHGRSRFVLRRTVGVGAQASRCPGTSSKER